MKKLSQLFPVYLLIATLVILGGIHLAGANKATATSTETCTDNQESCPSVTLTPTYVPSVTPTPTCTIGSTCINIDCPGQGECEVIIGNTPTPTPGPTATPTPGPTATPTPGSGGGGSNNGGSGSQPSQTILGTTTMAKTGGFEQTLMNSFALIGMVSLSIGSITYAKTKKA